ncbi:MAG TPA: hypothetical protein VL346_12530 [Acidobacteriaceae bacterium]|nr:hypothetical protein [Acidobacteriaceae bacterium]
MPDLFAPQAAVKKHDRGKQKQERASGPHPSAEISLPQLGFAAPSHFHLGDRWVQSSLDFLDEDHLLFTFRVPGLVMREHPEAGADPSEERNIRAMVLSLPSGRIEAEALWRLHDYATYLWTLPGGRFLLRDRNLLQIGNASLQLEPFLRFPGPVRYIELDPEEKMLVTQNIERRPDAAANGEGSIAGDIASNFSGASGADSNAASVLPMPGSPTHSPAARSADTANYLRVFRMNDRKILTTIQIPNGIAHVPIDGHGYYDAARGQGASWEILYHGFGGSESRVSRIDSACMPPLDPLAPGIVLVSACNDSGGRHLIALTRDGQRLWDTQLSATHVWPILTTSANGRRLARATLDITHPVTPSSPLDSEDIHSQTIQVFDVATGRVAITGPAAPILDGGGNFALSPSGNRFAVLNAGSIQVYDLTPAPPLPAVETGSP